MATPPAMFAPAWLCTSGMPRPSRIAAAIAAVVVLPFVAEIERAAARQARCRARRSRRVEAHQHLPGALVAPPPRSRESAPTVRASASLASSAPAISLAPPERPGVGAPVGGAGEAGCGPPAGGHQHRDRPLHGAHPHGQLADRVAVGVHRERPVARSRPQRRGRRCTPGMLTCSPLKTFGRIASGT